MVLHLLSSVIFLIFLLYKLLILPLIAVDMIAVTSKPAQESYCSLCVLRVFPPLLVYQVLPVNFQLKSMFLMLGTSAARLNSQNS